MPIRVGRGSAGSAPLVARLVPCWLALACLLLAGCHPDLFAAARQSRQQAALVEMFPDPQAQALAIAAEHGDARDGERRHEALDIMAPAGTPVLAVADGHVEKLFDSERGGLTVYQFEPTGRWCYYYAHLQSYAPGLVEGAEVKRGQVLGYVGSTGNAAPSAPHLHFAVFALGPERQWWVGTPVNPYPLLARPAPP